MVRTPWYAVVTVTMVIPTVRVKTRRFTLIIPKESIRTPWITLPGVWIPWVLIVNLPIAVATIEVTHLIEAFHRTEAITNHVGAAVDSAEVVTVGSVPLMGALIASWIADAIIDHFC
jgi:hypothetical protein